MRDEVLRQAKRIVVKIGSILVSSREAGLEPERIDRLADDLAALRSTGRELLVVSSGAIVSGIKKLSLKELEQYHKTIGHTYRKCPTKKQTKKDKPQATQVFAKGSEDLQGASLCYAWGKVSHHDAFIIFYPFFTHGFIL